MLHKVFTVFCLLIQFMLSAKAAFYKENITDFSKCSTTVSRSETSYTKFFEIDQDKTPKYGALLFDFHFSTLGASNAHILLAEKNALTSSDPVYEIVIGAGGNTYCELRRRQKAATKVTTKSRGELSAIEIRSFWLHVWNDGLVEVGRETEELAFLSWRDPAPLKLKYFSFSSWTGIEIKWFFDCDRSVTKGSTLVLTNTERLEHDLFQNYSTFVLPVKNESDMIDVDLNLMPQHVSLDEPTSKLFVKGAGYMRWRDQKLMWDPSDYDGKKSLKLRPYRIWTPDLRLHDYEVNLQDIILFNNGTVFCNVLLDVQTWCNLEDLSSWPADVHSCSLSFHFSRDGDRIKLQFLTRQENLFTLQQSSQWTVTNVTIKYGLPDESLDSSDDELPNTTFLLTLQRTSSIYKLIFLAPFAVVAICSLGTFWTSPFTYHKIVLCSIQLLMESVILIGLSNIIPGHPTAVPDLVSLYSESLICSAVLVIISIVVINLSRNEYDMYSMPDFLYYILSSKLLRNALFLTTNISEDGRYGNLSESPTKPKEDVERSLWVLLGKVIDRLGFILYSILFTYAISKRY